MRIVISVLVMLLPASMLMYSSYNAIRGSLNSVTAIVDAPLAKLISAKKIQSKILRTELPFHLYLNRGESADRDAFIKLSVEIDILFDTVSKIENLNKNDIDLLQSAQKQWQQAKNLGESLLTTTNIPPNHILIEKVDQFGRHLERSASLLDEISELSLENIKDIRFAAQDNEWKNIGVLSITFALGVLLALLTAMSLGQSFINPIKKVEQSITRLRRGDNNVRLNLENSSELEQISLEFNLLAERYEQIKDELDYLSTQDSLTGLFDRAKLNQEVKQEIERAKRYDKTFSLLLIDINHFSEVNQTYGRLVGDSVLCSVANTLRNTIRPTDIAARYGGDKFAIILSETDVPGSLETTQRIFEAIENEPLNIGDGKMLRVSISIGAATYPTNVGSDVALFSLAEQTLNRDEYEKKIGKLPLNRPVSLIKYNK